PAIRHPRLTKRAGILVNYSVGVKKGQLVRISGPIPAQPLVLEIFRAVVAAGGNPFVIMSPEEASEILLKNGSEDQLKFTNPVQMFMSEKLDCAISMWGEENTRALSNC